MKPKFDPSIIPEEERSPLVLQLFDLTETQAAFIQRQSEEIQLLKDEIARLKNQPPRPKIRPSRLEQKKKPSQINETVSFRYLKISISALTS